MALKIGSYVEKHEQIKFLKDAGPIEITQIKDGRSGQYLVTYIKNKDEIFKEEFNTIILVVGREPCTSRLNLKQIGIEINPKSEKIKTTYEQTSVANIYAIGDVIEEITADGREFELTPVAIKQGKLLAKRLFAGSRVKMEYNAVPTTLFTPLEYGCIGLAEEEAFNGYVQERIVIYETKYTILEWQIAENRQKICHNEDDERLLGLHVLMPNAGKITQGYALAFRLNATKHDFDMTVGLHPTCSEVFIDSKMRKYDVKDDDDA
jgi:thioredoxin reductase (NADPH)